MKDLIRKSDQKITNNFEAKQNAVGFFNILLEVAKRNPEIWKKIIGNDNEKQGEIKRKNY